MIHIKAGMGSQFSNSYLTICIAKLINYKRKFQQKTNKQKHLLFADRKRSFLHYEIELLPTIGRPEKNIQVGAQTAGYMGIVFLLKI